MASDENGFVKNYSNVEIDLVDEELIQKQTLMLIKDLRPEWREESISFKTFSNGITNRVFQVTHIAEPAEHLVFRVFGKNTEKVIDRQLKTISRLEKVGIAAPLHAKFSNGIVCGYLDGEPIDCKSVREPKIVDKICDAMARMHQVPLTTGEKPFILDKMRQFLENIPKSFKTDKENVLYQRYFGSNDLTEQFEHLKQLLTALNQPVVFCHNDLLINNILYDKNNDKVNFIDYEYADANYQLFDIANHFCEYAGVDEPDYSLHPSKEEQQIFIQKYLLYFLNRDPVQEEVDEMLSTVPFFEAAAHFFWALWALVQAGNSTIDFDYLKYAVIRHKMFAKIITQCKCIFG
ncbi:hypothetical protein FO519_002362 [Halicephalobus sp. NKZ332]|nr:hypothetical protein FO519_002362 [Halicephalobus sp. NKZ332]